MKSLKEAGVAALNDVIKRAHRQYEPELAADVKRLEDVLHEAIAIINNMETK